MNKIKKVCQEQTNNVRTTINRLTAATLAHLPTNRPLEEEEEERAQITEACLGAWRKVSQIHKNTIYDM